ncbi:hypothetical protein KY092_02355 [Natronomonas gomsonensis]|jgi:uncharacterized membrane protein required for colicin V production|uniref:hypothetical protein n=1 Tax=Natronomonas gomsonensis TaxID=1046043 RepID=UPI0020CA7639|nr:hypothetical protein [Natronomonas gomsonensis]MCY4729398.1 hypothetical protein [Natronomonas gomsonensis]
MESTKPLSFVLAALVALLAIGGVVELLRSTFTSEFAVAAIATIALVAVAVIGMVVVGAQNRQWLSNPDSYW